MSEQTAELKSTPTITDLKERFGPHIAAAKSLLAESGLDLNDPNVKRARTKMTRKLVEASAQSSTDQLTELKTKQWFDEELKLRCAAADRNGEPLYVVAFDIDSFKEINDFYGHPMGDRMLKFIGNLPVRKAEPIARLGGDEFAQIISNSTLEQIATEVLHLSEAYRERSKSALTIATVLEGREASDAPRNSTLSFGVTQHLKGEAPEKLSERADRALYHSKNEGKNRASVATVDNSGQITYGPLV